MRGTRTARAAVVLTLVAVVSGGTSLTASAEDPPDNPTHITVDQDHVLPGTKVYITGTGAPDKQVDFYAGPKDDGNWKLVGHKITNPDGSFSLGTTIRETTTIEAEIPDNQDSWSIVTVESYTTIKVRAHALGSGKVKWEVNGGPSLKGYGNVYQRNVADGWTRTNHVATNKYGDAVVVTTSRFTGQNQFRLTFHYPGSTPGERILYYDVK